MAASTEISPSHRLAGRVRPVIARIKAELDEYLPSDTAETADLHRRWLSRMAQALAACTSALPGGEPVAPRRAGAAAASSRVFETLMTELVAAVGDHPDRDRLLVAGSVAVHEALRGTDDPVAGTSGPDVVERQRLARDVHDWVGNGVSLALRQLELHAIDTARGGPDPGRRVAEARLTLEELLLCTRRLVADLRGVPWVTDLETELREYVARVNVLGADVAVQVSPEAATMPHRVRDELFVTVREALRNAFTHARATRVEVTVELVDGQVTARVDDDGVGLAGGVAPPGRGSGLTMMRERVGELGGRLEVRARQPRGTRVELRVDLDGGADHAG